MRGRKIWAIGGFVAGAVLILFGVAALYLGVTSYQLVHDELSQEKIVGGEDMSPKRSPPASKKPGSRTSTSRTATSSMRRSTQAMRRCFSEYMRVHALEATGGLTYAEMGRFQSAANPGDAAGTNDEAAAAKDEEETRSRTASGTSGSTRPRSRPRSTSRIWPSSSRCSGSSSGSRSSSLGSG